MQHPFMQNLIAIGPKYRGIASNNNQTIPIEINLHKPFRSMWEFPKKYKLFSHKIK